MSTIDVASDAIKSWRKDPCLFMRQVLNAEPDAWQAEALREFGSEDPVKRIALKAAAGPGKSAILAVMAWNFLLCYADKGDHPKGFALSITAENLSTNFWPELSKWQSRSPLLEKLFTWTKTRVFCREFPSTWFLQARSFSRSANAEEQGRALAGLHSGFCFIALDESSEINPSILRTGEQAMGNVKFGRFVQAGNPTTVGGCLYEAVTKLRDKWTVINITGDPDDPNRSHRIDIEWAKSMIAIYGRDNNWVRAYILSQWPLSAVNTLLTLTEVEEAVSRKYIEKDYEFSERVLGVDVARFGLDSTVIQPMSHPVMFNPVEMMGARGNEVAARIAIAKEKWNVDRIFIDSTGGFASSTCDSLAQAGINHVEVNFSGKPIDGKFLNKRAEMWFLMAEWVKKGGKIPNHPKLINDLIAPEYSFTNGKFALEPKEIMKKRLGRSPDFGDAACLCFALPRQPRITESDIILSAYSKNHNKTLHDWDPYAEA